MKDNSLSRRIQLLIFFRVVIATFLLGIVSFIQIKTNAALPREALAPVYYVIALTYLLSFFCFFIPKFTKNTSVNIYLQSLLDISLITGLVYLTGGIESIYPVLYPLVIIYSALFLSTKGGLISASVCSISYGLMLDLEFYGIIQPLYPLGFDYSGDAGYVLSRIFVHIIAFYIIALLTSFAGRQEKKTRELLAEKESAFDQLDLLHKSIIESVNIGILTIDLNGNIKSFNTGAEKITGFSRYQVINKKIQGVFSYLPELFDEKSLWVGDNRFEISYSEKILGWSVSPLVDANGEKIGGIMIFQDLTSIKKMEQQLEKAKRLALVGEMAAGFAHEIRNPLASISGPIQMLSKDLNLDETDKRLMQIILRGKDRLEGFVKDFLLLARHKESERKNINVEVVVDDVLESLQFVPEWNENIAVKKKISSNAFIYGNYVEIRQVIWNLILNSIQAMPDGGKLSIKTFSEKEYLKLQISDNGCGIEAKNHERIFEPFYTTKESGTGLGMAIVNKIVEGHKGKTIIKSEPGKGTECTVLLPKKE